MANRTQILKQKFQHSLALPFEQVLPEGLIQTVLHQHGVKYRQTLHTPIVVLWAWLSQVLDADKSLSHSVKRIVAWLAGAGEQLLQQSAEALSGQVTAEQGWCGRRVKAYDGTSLLMSDTPANQKAYPQHCHQKAGCGLPLAKVVVWFCGTIGTVLNVAIAAFHTSEWSLARQLYRCLQPDDVLVADSAYGTYVDLAGAQQAQAGAVFRKHHARHCDFRHGKQLGKGDHIVQWQRPQQCPKALRVREFKSLPASASEKCA